MIGSGGACKFECLLDAEREFARSIEALLTASQDLKALEEVNLLRRTMVPGVVASPAPPTKPRQLLPRASCTKPKYGRTGDKKLVQRSRKNHDVTATCVLKKWLFQNLQRPYPSREERSKMALASFLTEHQVVHWFNNARKKKRMVQDVSLVLKDSSLLIESSSSSTNEDQDI